MWRRFNGVMRFDFMARETTNLEGRSHISGYRRDVDGLRAVAILGVVAYHVGVPLVTGGYAGVDVFFVVSGFLITRLIVGELDRSGTISLANFYERRARRLLPALSVVVLVTLVLGFPLLQPFPNAHLELGRSAVYTLLFAANRYFRLYVGEYFQDTTDLMPLAHTWSLGVEEQFYLFYPLALLLFFRLGPKFEPRRLRIAVAIVTAMSLALSIGLSYRHLIRAFYWAPARAWELGVGALVALWIAEEPEKRPASGAFLSIAGLAMITGAFATLTPTSQFPGALALAPVLGAALIIGAVPLSPGSIVARALSSKPMVELGRISYAWYLWHWPILVIARRWRLGDANLFADIGWAALSLALAVLTTRFIERPFRWPTGGWLVRRRNFATIAVIATTVLIVLSITLRDADRLWPDHVVRMDDARPPSACLVSSLQSGSLAFGTCRDSSQRYPAAVAIWGDSHAGAWAPVLWRLGDSEHVATFSLTRSACPPLLGLTLRRAGSVDTGCVQENAAVTAWLRSMVARSQEGGARESLTDAVRGVVLAARWPRYVQGGVDAAHYAPLLNSRDAAPLSSPDSVRAGLERTLAFTDSIGLRVLIMLPPPEYPYRLPECIAVRSVQQCGMSRHEADAYRESSVHLMRALAAAHRNVRVIDPIGFFCDSLDCPAMSREVVAMRDASHVSASAARAFAPEMREDFRWLVERR
jgi:peptidoglycan/LPS O-acetylase OafA/YrhL